MAAFRSGRPLRGGEHLQSGSNFIILAERATSPRITFVGKRRIVLLVIAVCPSNPFCIVFPPLRSISLLFSHFIFSKRSSRRYFLFFDSRTERNVFLFRTATKFLRTSIRKMKKTKKKNPPTIIKNDSFEFEFLIRRRESRFWRSKRRSKRFLNKSSLKIERRGKRWN